MSRDSPAGRSQHLPIIFSGATRPSVLQIDDQAIKCPKISFLISSHLVGGCVLLACVCDWNKKKCVTWPFCQDLPADLWTTFWSQVLERGLTSLEDQKPEVLSLGGTFFLPGLPPRQTIATEPTSKDKENKSNIINLTGLKVFCARVHTYSLLQMLWQDSLGRRRR